MQLSIFAITTPPARNPGDLHQKFAPTLALLHPSFCQRAGREFVGVVPKGRAFSAKLFLPFLEFSSLWQKSATDNWGLFVTLKLYTF